ncbi:uncharacterized protein CC84DRAFT_413525 [Paraphaeosphaeria sporulosa]|uniref:Uncharacterized protein n=1 Tax=Paraphaeosphaeria sporulosa TaxID=1460663 RepID=A0A177BW65_9PLEO|nr:uncharacterized protein CC84DRAFT_413525 [Paraphaeosphaeria sporulosa]OAF98981.1 hypothetical protein CC84DRAFT_413525 [Paraphaeosphaeria sporulosa]
MASRVCVVATSAHVQYVHVLFCPVGATTQPSRKARPRRNRGLQHALLPHKLPIQERLPRLQTTFRLRCGMVPLPMAFLGLLTCMSATPSRPRDLAPSALLHPKALCVRLRGISDLLT